MKANKLHYVEILKILSISIVILLHTLGVFAFPTITYIKDTAFNSEGLTILVRLLWRWTMSIMFFFAGIGAYYSLKKRTPKQYIIERLKRLYVPLVFGTLFIISLQTYILAISRDGFQGSFFDFFPNVFFNGVGMGPQGYFNWGHLWFIAYLFHFSLLALPLFVYCLKESKPYIIHRILKVVEKGSVILPLVILILIECILRPKWPGSMDLINDWANFSSFLVWFVCGFFYAGNFLKFNTSPKVYPYFLVIYLISAVFLYGRWSVDVHAGYNTGFILLMVLAAFNAWACIVFLVDFGKNKLNFTNPIISHASDLTMPLYLLHYLVLTSVGYYVVQLQLGMIAKIALIFFSTYIITIALCELVKRLPFLKLLLGLK